MSAFYAHCAASSYANVLAPELIFRPQHQVCK
jgi:hypothetical protein